jgi:hypothetical protein
VLASIHFCGEILQLENFVTRKGKKHENFVIFRDSFAIFGNKND